MVAATRVELVTSPLSGVRSNQLSYAAKTGTPKGIRTPVSTVKGWCPWPLDDGCV